MLAVFSDISVISNIQTDFSKIAGDEYLVVSGSLDRKRVIYERPFCETTFLCEIFLSVQHRSEIDFY
jgi:hypothetical protein